MTDEPKYVCLRCGKEIMIISINGLHITSDHSCDPSAFKEEIRRGRNGDSDEAR